MYGYVVYECTYVGVLVYGVWGAYVGVSVHGYVLVWVHVWACGMGVCMSIDVWACG